MIKEKNPQIAMYPNNSEQVIINELKEYYRFNTGSQLIRQALWMMHRQTFPGRYNNSYMTTRQTEKIVRKSSKYKNMSGSEKSITLEMTE